MRSIVFSLFVVLVSASPVWAGQNNPDLLDVSSYFSSTSPKGASHNSAYIRHGGKGANNASGEVGDEDSSAYAEVWWDIYEPDTVKRSGTRGKLKQGSYLEVGFYTWDGSSSWDSTTVKTCSAVTNTRGSDDTPETANWRVNCRGAFEAMGLTESQADHLDRLLGDYVNTTRDKINISGHGPVGEEAP